MFRIFGPPGTGKTTTLLNIVEKTLASGVPPNEIAFLAFTRKAANEAKERAAERFGLSLDELPYFRTLHSLAYRLTGLSGDQIMQGSHYGEIEAKIGIPLVSGTLRPDEMESDSSAPIKKESPILKLITLSRLKRSSLRREYDMSDLDYNWLEVDYVARAIQSYKDTFGVYDYTDMLELFAKEGHLSCPKFKLSMIDEAQDLSPLQWEIAHMIDQKSDVMYCAGDDDQAIYKWSGADVEHFINLPGGSEVLEQSYRIPAAIHSVAEKISRRILRRFPKTYLPKKESGSVKDIVSIEECDFSTGSWLVLSQAQFQYGPVRDYLKQQGYFFEYASHLSIPQKIRTALDAWRRLNNGENVNLTGVLAAYSYMTGNGDKIARGFKKIIAPDDQTFTYEQLVSEWGLLVEKGTSWEDALDRLPDVDKAYIHALMRRNENIGGTPRIRLSTIHGSKGGEADNVLLFTDLTAAAESSLRSDPDSLHRVFYVAVTRAKKSLFILQPANFTRYYII
jgi:DNA helicase II / ATP-dependent DNA helicase PcrA